MIYRQPIRTIYLYDEPDAAGLDIEQVGGYLVSQLTTVEVIPRSDFFTYQFARFGPEERSLLEQETQRQLTAAQVDSFPSLGEAIGGEPITPEDLGLDFVFRAPLYQAICHLLIDPKEAAADQLHIILTENGIGSWSDGRDRFSLHAIAMGVPSIISLPGLVEAIPRPREYDFKRAQFAMFGLPDDTIEDLADEFADRTFGYGDPRINEICKGYALMACMYRMTGEAFCPEPECRLRAAQNQEELIELQCGEDVGLCARHEQILREIAAGGLSVG